METFIIKVTVLDSLDKSYKDKDDVEVPPFRFEVETDERFLDSKLSTYKKRFEAISKQGSTVKVEVL